MSWDTLESCVSEVLSGQAPNDLFVRISVRYEATSLSDPLDGLAETPDVLNPFGRCLTLNFQAGSLGK